MLKYFKGFESYWATCCTGPEELEKLDVSSECE